MKKLYLFIAAMLVSISAFAVDYYLIGGFNLWATKDANAKFTAQGDGTYVLDYTGKLSTGFKINDGTWTNGNANFGGSAILKPGVTYNLTASSNSGNIPIEKNIINPHLVFNPTAKTLLITGDEEEATYCYGIHGVIFGDPNWSTVEMTEDNGKWTLTSTVIAGEFGIKEMDGDTKAQTRWISSAGAAAVSFNTAISCKEEGTNFSLGTGGTYTFTYDPEAMTLTVTPEGEYYPDVTIYWDNTDAQWTEIYAIVTDADGNAYDEEGITMTAVKGVANVYSVTFPSNYVNVTFTDGGSDSSNSFTVEDSYIYTKTTSKAYSVPVDYTGWYVNIVGDFNGWIDNGIAVGSTGITKHTGLAIGTDEFKVKVYNGTDVYHSNGSAIATDTWVSIPDNVYDNMTIAGATADDVFDVEFNCATNEIRVTKAAPIDYTTYLVNIVGDFNDWNYNGVAPNAEGVAVCSATDVDTTFKVKVWNGAIDLWYAKDGTVTLDTEVDINGNSENMSLPTDAQTGKVTMTFNCKTGTLKVVKSSDGIEAIEADGNDSAVYYNLQGVRVDNPTQGLYIVVRGDKVAKEIVR